jgi:lipoprotein-releasing system ATP-binding protein
MAINQSTSSNENHILRTVDVRKSFVDPVEVEILKSINICVNKGEFVSIMGKSGCGKSTLLYILSTMDTNYKGQLYLGDRLLTGLSGNELAVVRNEFIGFVFQFHYLLPEFTVLQNVMMPGLKLAKKSAEEVEFDAMNKLKLLTTKRAKRRHRFRGDKSSALPLPGP